MRCYQIASLFTVLICTAFSVDVLLGVEEGKEDFYKKTSFICDEGSRVLSDKQINDDYCDCLDGSDEPGTSACSNGHFYCKNKGHFGLSIASSKVNDGICDCCDGSDEYLNYVSCPNTCAEEHDRWTKENASRLEVMNKGSAILNEWISAASDALKGTEDKKASLDSKVAELEESIAAAKKELEEFRLELEKAEDASRVSETESMKRLYQKFGLDKLEGNDLRYLIIALISQKQPHDKQVIQKIQEWIAQLNTTIAVDETAAVEEVIEEMKKAGQNPEIEKKEANIRSLETSKGEIERQLQTLGMDSFYGPQNEFYMMKGQCYKKTINKYEYQVCPYGTSKQDSTSLGGEFSIVNDANESIKDLGWDVHVDNQNKMKNGDIYFYWKNGRSCWNGPNRSLKLKLVCHDSVELLQLIEPSMCVYVGELGTPAVCPIMNYIIC